MDTETFLLIAILFVFFLILCKKQIKETYVGINESYDSFEFSNGIKDEKAPCFLVQSTVSKEHTETVQPANSVSYEKDPNFGSEYTDLVKYFNVPEKTTVYKDYHDTENTHCTSERCVAPYNEKPFYL